MGVFHIFKIVQMYQIAQGVSDHGHIGLQWTDIQSHLVGIVQSTLKLKNISLNNFKLQYDKTMIKLT